MAEEYTVAMETKKAVLLQRVCVCVCERVHVMKTTHTSMTCVPCKSAASPLFKDGDEFLQ